MAKNLQTWQPGDLFIIQQRDGICSVGQILDHMMKNVVSCAFYDIRVPHAEERGAYELRDDHLIAALSVTQEQLDAGVWKVIGHQDIALDRSAWPNEDCRSHLWVGASIQDASIAEELLDAYNSLVPWDDWHDPAYLDTLLVAPDRKPKHVVYKKR